MKISFIKVVKSVLFFTAFFIFITLVSVTTIQKKDDSNKVFHTFLGGMLMILPEHGSETQLVPRDDIDKISTINNVLYYYPFLQSNGFPQGKRVKIIGIDLDVPKAEKIYSFYEVEQGANIFGSDDSNDKQSENGCVVSDKLKRAMNLQIGSILPFKTFKCKVTGIAKSDFLVAANFVITDIKLAQTERIANENFYRFLNKRSVEAVSCGQCHPITEAIRQAAKEASEVFEAHSLTSGAFVIYKDDSDPVAIQKEIKKRLPGVEVRLSEDLNNSRLWYYSK